MLSAYMRFKYPNVIDAALAASAPIYMTTFQGSEREFFFSAVTEVREQKSTYFLYVTNLHLMSANYLQSHMNKSD